MKKWLALLICCCLLLPLAAQAEPVIIDKVSGLFPQFQFPEDAALLECLIRQLKPPKDVLCVMHEPVTGVHVGPGMLALYFEGAPVVRLR